MKAMAIKSLFKTKRNDEPIEGFKSNMQPLIEYF
jgi:hypothetical protein